jgi:hypothetical protein
MDVLSKVPVFEAIDDTNASPFIVGNYVNQLAFASQTFSTTSLNRYTWLIQNESYIRSDCVRFCHVTSAYKDRIDWINSQVSSPVKEQKNECIYLTRGKSSGRKVLNESELICVLKKYGFKVVDTNGKHILDQATIFKNARYVVAPHGAGLTNILFRGSNPLSILELHPIHEYTDFKRMCDCFGHQWHSLMGRVVPGDVRHADFTINVSDFETKLAELLAT